ncbi:MAG: hypothetical protein U0974_06210 [Gemmatimonadales bacterium]|nr:hypothetical protein [Gemmatimonadales bacterium]MDZ4389305.1 hypothetical protein [Gemmatimonadales bacterium]
MSVRHLFLPACVLLAGCGGSTGETSSDVVVTDSAGVTIVTSSGTDRPLPWTLAQLALIGGEDDGPASFTRAYPSTVGVDGRDQIHLLDTEAMQLHRFSAAGEPLGSAGRKGGGPGEFAMPFALGVNQDGRRAVFDFGKRALLEWGGDDSLLSEVKWPLGASRYPTGVVGWHGDTLLLLTQGGDSLLANYFLTSIVDADTTDLVSLSHPRPKMQQFACVGMALSPLFSPSLKFGVGGERLAVTREAAYVVDLFTADGRRSIRRDITPTVPVATDAKRLYPDGMTVRFDAGSCTTPAEEVAEKAGLAPFIPLVKEVAVAPDGTLWVQRMTFVGEPAATDVFNAEGRYLGTMAGRALPLGFLSGDRVLFAVEDAESGITRIGVYQLTRNPESGTT